MNIAIFTQPLGHNYGGDLQAFALQHVLKELGHNPTTINYRLRGRKRRAIKEFIFNSLFFRPLSLQSRNAILNKQLQNFVRRNIVMSEQFEPPINKNSLQQYSFDAYIVGSDQTWRPIYSPFLPTFFLDFLENDNTVKKISYAASFGTEEMEFSDSEIEMAKKLLQKFHAISVRESSGVKLCKDYFNANAIHVLDPTMLLEKEDYCKLIYDDEKSNIIGESLAKDKCCAYILDDSPEKTNIFDKVASELGLRTHAIKAGNFSNRKIFSNWNTYKEVFCKRDKGLRKADTEWLQLYRDARFVVTDSFHGVVFSLIFNKPFLAVINHSRGASRFISLLEMFNLKNRLIETVEDVSDDLLKTPIDWDSVNRIREIEKQKALTFLKNNLA